MRLDELIPILLFQVALVLALSRLVGALFGRLRQPQVVGEMAAGIMLGPSLFGWLAHFAHARGWAGHDWWVIVFPAASVQALGVLSQVGVIFFLFLVGLELDPKLLRNRGRAALLISHVSIVAPFMLGAAFTLLLYPRLFNDTPHMRFTPVALFMGAAMSITAFPVLARILTERNLHKTNVGAVAITCAAVDDVTAWCMLAFVVAVARAVGAEAGGEARPGPGHHHGGTRGALRAGDVLRGPAVPPPAPERLRPPGAAQPERGGRHPAAHARLGLDHRKDRHPRPVRGVSDGRDHAQGDRLRAHAGGEAGGLHGGVPAADLLRLHRPEDADRLAEQRRPVARHRRGDPRRLPRQVRRLDAGRPRLRHLLARIRHHRHPDEHPRADGAGDPDGRVGRWASSRRSCSR